eukprot:jgi/Mesvir1/14787/Mv05427-RA.1
MYAKFLEDVDSGRVLLKDMPRERGAHVDRRPSKDLARRLETALPSSGDSRHLFRKAAKELEKRLGGPVTKDGELVMTDEDLDKAVMIVNKYIFGNGFPIEETGFGFEDEPSQPYRYGWTSSLGTGIFLNKAAFNRVFDGFDPGKHVLVTDNVAVRSPLEYLLRILAHEMSHAVLVKALTEDQIQDELTHGGHGQYFQRYSQLLYGGNYLHNGEFDRVGKVEEEEFARRGKPVPRQIERAGMASHDDAVRFDREVLQPQWDAERQRRRMRELEMDDTISGPLEPLELDTWSSVANKSLYDDRKISW